jgi:hypothetical protein
MMAKMEADMGLTGVNLLDPNQEPSDEQLGLLMEDFITEVRARKATSKQVLADAVEDAFAKALAKNSTDEPQSHATPSL